MRSYGRFQLPLHAVITNAGSCPRNRDLPVSRRGHGIRTEVRRPSDVATGEHRMKVLWTTLLAAFLLTFLAGYLRGRSDAQAPDEIASYALSKVNLEDINGQPYLTYRAKGKLVYYFDVDRNELRRGNIAAFSNEQGMRRSELGWLIFSDPSFKSALGGVTLGYTAKDLLSEKSAIVALWRDPERHGPSAVIGAILAAISGYAAGYWTGISLSRPADDSPQVISIVGDKKLWIDAKDVLYTSIENRLRNEVLRASNRQISDECNRLLESVDVSFANHINETSGVSSADLVALLLTKDKVEKICSNRAAEPQNTHPD
jgi:hypothetical protein